MFNTLTFIITSITSSEVFGLTVWRCFWHWPCCCCRSTDSSTHGPIQTAESGGFLWNWWRVGEVWIWFTVTFFLILFYVTAKFTYKNLILSVLLTGLYIKPKRIIRWLFVALDKTKSWIQMKGYMRSEVKQRLKIKCVSMPVWGGATVQLLFSRLYI